MHSSLTAVRCFDNGYVGKQPVAWKEYCAEYWLKELLESMNRCTGRRDITEILLKTALITIQSINHFILFYCRDNLSKFTLYQTSNLDSSNLKQFGDDNFKFDKNGKSFPKG